MNDMLQVATAVIHKRKIDMWVKRFDGLDRRLARCVIILSQHIHQYVEEESFKMVWGSARTIENIIRAKLKDIPNLKINTEDNHRDMCFKITITKGEIQHLMKNTLDWENMELEEISGDQNERNMEIQIQLSN